MTLEFAASNPAPIALDLEFRVAPGELVALLGRSGAGKTTILRTIAGLWRPARGRVAVNGVTWLDTAGRRFVPVHRRRVGVVFQSYALFPHLSAQGNVTAVMDELPRRERPAEAQRLLDLVGLSGFAARRPAELSGGQQQRVAIARALARKPEVLLLDEPFASIDQATRRQLHAQIRALRDHLQMPVVLVTHDLEDARALADRVVVVHAGRAVRSGTAAQVLSDPGSLRALGVRELVSVLAATIEGQEDDGLTRLVTAAGVLFIPAIDGAAGDSVELRVPAHEVLLSTVRPDHLSALNVLPVTIEQISEGDGPGAVVQLACGGQTLLARVTRRSLRVLDLREGFPCFAVLKALSLARNQVIL